MALVMALAARAVEAQSCNTGNGNTNACSLNFTMSMTVNKTVRLEASPSSLSLVSSNASAAEYFAGFKTQGSLVVTARANSGVSVSIAAATTNFSYAGSASPAPTKAASTVQWSTDGFATAGVNLSTVAATIIPSTGSGTAGATSGTSKTVSFRTGLAWAADPPGTYTLTLNLTITAP
jgi:hypothetical protein